MTAPDPTIALDRETLRTLEHAALWIGRLITNGGHKECAIPADAERTLAQLEALISRRVDQAPEAGPDARVVAALLSMVEQHCGPRDDSGDYDSWALSANAEAMEVLSELGYLTITADCGRRVIAKRTEKVSP